MQFYNSSFFDRNSKCNIFQDKRSRSEAIKVPKGDDLIVNIADKKKFEKLCASGNCSSMPARQKMQIKVIICDINTIVIYTKTYKFYPLRSTVNPNPVQLTAFPCKSILTGINLLSLQGNPVLIAGSLF